MSRCPSPSQLDEFLDQRGNDLDVIAHHVERCRDCQTKLDELTGAAAILQTASVARQRQEASSVFLSRLKDSPPSRSGREKFLAKASAGKLPEVAGYEILGELGRGGMGVVYQARQMGLNRLVALKMILAGSHAGPKDLARFRQEAEAVARLRHPNIIQIYDIGESEGRPFLALEFVEGASLAHLLQGVPQAHLPAARLIEKLAGAMQEAHQQGVIHRDLKPANILLQMPPDVKSAAGNLQAAVPKITDFGLAKRLDEAPNGTQSGEMVGTPSYMAPEQAAGTGAAVQPAADVYALGAILYELLTGRPPFRGPTPFDTVLQVLHEDPVRPSYLRRDLPRDLETICLKCLAKDPSKRYASAAALAADLYRFRKGKPIQARPVGLHERAWKWAKHRPLAASLLALLVLVGLGSYSVIAWQLQEARLARDDMEIEREQAEQARDEMNAQREEAVAARRNEAEQRQKARAALYFSRIAQSQLQWRVNDFRSAEQSLARCMPAAGQEDDRGWEWHYLQGLFHHDMFALPHGHSGQGGSVAYDPLGKRIATVVSGPTAGETPLPGEVRIWDARTGGLLHTWEGPNTVHRLAFHPDGRRLALATTDGSVMVWDAITGRELLRKQMHLHTVASLAFSLDGKIVASAGWDRTLKLWDSTTGEVRHTLRGHEGPIQSVAFHPSRPIVASASWDASVKLWDLTTGKEMQTLRGHKMGVHCLAFSPDGQSLVSASSNGNLKIWDLAASRIVQSLTADTGGVLHLAFSPDGRHLAKAGKDGTVRIWHLATGVERMSFRAHSTPVEGVHFSPDCQRVVSLSPGEGLAKVWDLTRHPEYATFARTDADVEALAFADRGQRLMSVTGAGKLQSWDAATGMLLDERTFPLNQEILSPAVPVTLDAEGKLLAARREDDARVVQVWDTATGAERARLTGHRFPVTCVRFSSDRHYLTTSAYDVKLVDAPHEIKVWDTATGNNLATIAGKGRIFNLALSPDHRWLAWSGQEGMLTLLDWKKPQDRFEIVGHQGDVSGLAFSADGKWLASAGMEDRRVKIWQVEQLLQGQRTSWQSLSAPSLIGDLSFSPDSRRLAAMSRDMVKLWEVETGHEALTLRGAPQRYWDPSFNPRLAFSPDGVQLAGTNWNETISTWDAPTLDSEEQFAKFQEKRRRFADQLSSFWHLQEAEVCLQHKNLAAARFHLNLLKEELSTGPFQARRERLIAALKAATKE